MSHRIQLAICQAIDFLVVVNLVVFVSMSIYLGGTAGNGKVDNGHYYLGDHGHYTKVSEAIFNYSNLHWKIVLWSMLLGFISFGWSGNVRMHMRSPRLEKRSRPP